MSKYSEKELDSLSRIQESFEAKLPYTLALLQKTAAKSGTEDTTYAKILLNVGFTYMKLREWNKSEEYLSKAITIHAKKAPEHLNCADALHYLGMVHVFQGHVEETKKYWKQSLELRKKY